MIEAPKIAFDAGAEPHPDDLYTYGGLAPTIGGLDAVDDEQADFFREHGYLAVRNALSGTEIEDARQAMSDLIRGGQVANERCMIMYEAAAKGRLEEMSLDDRELAVRKLFHFDGVDPRLDAVMQKPSLLAAVDKLGCRDPQLFQTMALLKGPGGREKPWHQDHAYFNVELKNRIVGVWIALDEATAANGCMHIMPGRHREPVIHFKRRDWQICDTTTRQMQQNVLAVPLPPGGLLFFDSLLPHGTPRNNTSSRRQALQFHYAPAERLEIAIEQRLAIFGSEGKDVEC